MRPNSGSFLNVLKQLHGESWKHQPDIFYLKAIFHMRLNRNWRDAWNKKRQTVSQRLAWLTKQGLILLQGRWQNAKLQLCSSWQSVCARYGIREETSGEREETNMVRLTNPPSLQRASMQYPLLTGFYQCRAKTLWTSKFSRYIVVLLTAASLLTDSALGGEFLSEDPQALCEYIVHYDKATSLGSLTPCHITGDYTLWRRSSVEILWRGAYSGTASFLSTYEEGCLTDWTTGITEQF